MSQNLIITISRQYGSGGRETGVLLSKQMGIPMYDRELQTVAAARSGIDLKLLENVDETASNSLLYTLVMKSGNNITDPSTLPLSDKLFAAQSEIIREYAAQGSCIFVGRCADFVLRNHPNVVKVFIHSEINARINRIKRLHQVNAREAEAATLALELSQPMTTAIKEMAFRVAVALKQNPAFDVLPVFKPVAPSY